MERSSNVCALIGVLVGAAATYGIMKNKDKIVEKFEELEEKLEETMEARGVNLEKAKDMYKAAAENVHSAMDKISAMIHSKDFPQMDKEHLLHELQALKEKVSKHF